MPDSPPHDDDNALVERKRTLRAQVRTRRRARRDGPGAALRSATAADLASTVLTGADRLLTPGAWVAAYQALPTEPPTDALISGLLERGVRVMLPVLLEDKDLDWAEVLGPHRDQDLGHSLGEQMGRDAIARASLVVVPALAVGPDGRRLGQGGGSYDRALPRRTSGTPVVALLYDDDFLDEPVPALPHDARVDAVVCPGRGWQDIG